MTTNDESDSMKYRLWQAGWAGAVLFTLLAMVFAFAAVWSSDPQLSDNLGMSAMIMTISGVIGLGVMGCWTSEYSVYQREQDRPVRLPRAERKQLKKERARILLQHKIDKLEEEHQIARSR